MLVTGCGMLCAWTQLRHGSVVYAVPGQHKGMSLQSEAMGDIPEELLIGAATSQMRAHSARVTNDNGPDLQELQPNRAHRPSLNAPSLRLLNLQHLSCLP